MPLTVPFYASPVDNPAQWPWWGNGRFCRGSGDGNGSDNDNGNGTV